MKKIIAVMISIVTVFVTLFIPVGAEAYEEEKEYFEDGSYIVVGFKEYHNDNDTGVEGEEENAEARTFLGRVIDILKRIIEFLSGRKTVEKTKYITYFDSNGKILWRFYVKGKFSYNGKKAECKKSESYCDIYDSDWKLISKSSGKKDNTAQGSVTMRQYKLAVPLKTIEKSLTLICDKYGNIE